MKTKISYQSVLIFALWVSINMNPYFLTAQNVNDNLQVNTYCTTSTSSSGCPSFRNTCNSNSGWTSSNGTPQMIYWAPKKNPNDLPQEVMILIGSGNSSEGAFYPYTFTAGYWYTVSVDLSSTGGPGYFTFLAATGLSQHLSSGGCQESPAVQSTQTKQQFGTIIGPGDNYQTTFNMTFQANATYKQFWMYVTGTGSPSFSGTVTNVQINTLWNTSCLPPSFVNASTPGTGQANVAWGSVAGATSYNIRFKDETTIYGGNQFNSFVPPTPPENGIHFTGVPTGPITVDVQANCANGRFSSWTTAPGNVQVNDERRLIHETASPEISENSDSLVFNTGVFKMHPNPASSQVTVSYHAQQNGNGHLVLLNQLGKVIISRSVWFNEGQNDYLIDINHLPIGVYIFKMEERSSSHVTKLLITR